MAQPVATPEHDSLPESRTRVDTAHAAEMFSEPNAPSLDLLQAIAGRDSEQAPLQLRRQALELATSLRDRHRVLDQRESELNARTALLENELRSSRLKQQNKTTPAEPVSAATAHGRRWPKRWRLSPGIRMEHVSTTTNRKRRRRSRRASFGLRGRAQRNRGRAQRSRGTRMPTRSTNRPSGSISGGQLQQREAKLDARQQHLDQLQEQITRLHREALELRLATEEVWARLIREDSPAHLAERVEEARQRLSEHYRLANESLAQRTDELHRLRQELHEQEQRLRGQRRELQLWVDRRYDEIQAHTSQLIVRERELARMEAEFERQSMQWQRQREAYRQEIEQLTRHA